MADFELDPKTIDYDALPPLVRKGEGAAEVIDGIVDAWATQLDEDTEYDECPGVTLDRVALVDGNTGEPIDLGNLLKRVAERVAGLAPAVEVASGVTVALRGCRIPETNAQEATLPFGVRTMACQFAEVDLHSAKFGGYAWFDSAIFGGVAGFESASFGGAVRFHSASFRGDADFQSASFGGYAGFDSASFGAYAGFESASFGGYAGFDWASFGGRVGFESASFGGYAGLNSASFGGYAGFDSASFGGDAGFFSASFGGDADFESASFGGHANFRLASFGGDADFRSASFKRSVFVERCTFAVQPVFVAARFSDQQAFKTDASFAAARFQNDAGDTASFGRRVPSLEARTGSASPRSAAAWLRGWRGFVARRLWWRAVVQGSSRRLRWDTVRAFGESAILTRASTSALVLVPITTALWPALRRAVEHIGQQQGGQLLLPEGTSVVLPDDATLVISETTATGLTPTSPETAWVLPEDMPWVWAALFFAALFVVLGRVLYQAFVPHEVREATRVDFIEQQATTYRQAEPDERRQLIQRAIEAVDQAGRDPVLREFRHRRLVRDDGLVVWIPERVEDFEYDAGRVPNPARRDDVRAALGKAGASEEDEAWDGSSAKPQMLRTAEPVMSADSRRVIAVRAGAEARYDLVTRQHRRWAWAAMWLYTLAMVLVIVVVYDQSMAILRETGLHGASEVVRYGLPAVCLVALTGMLSWLVIDALFGWLWPNLGRRWKRLTAG